MTAHNHVPYSTRQSGMLFRHAGWDTHSQFQINVVAFRTDRQVTGEALAGPWVETVPHEELLNAYSDWGRDAMTILEHIKTPSKWSVHAVSPPLSSFVNANIVLVGDAASYLHAAITVT